MTDQELEQALEALLFSSSTPLSPKLLSEWLPETTPARVRDAAVRLNRFYEESSRAFRLEQVADGLQLRTLPELRPWVQKLETVKTIRLSMPMMETLAIVAYKQPVTRASGEFIRGVDCSHILRTLLQRKLVRVIGRELLPGRPSLYGTSKTFLEVFGLTHLKNLPLLAELDLDKDEDGNQLELPLDSDASAEASSAPD